MIAGLRWRFTFLLTGSLSAFLAISSVAQVRCATVEHTAALYQKFNKTPQPEKFEQWIRQRSAQQFQSGKQQRTHAGPYQIPVVVHIIHNGEPIGIGRNISDEQVISQIRVLNHDFKRQNADAVLTPEEFQSVAGSLDIQFVLARQDPNGDPTTGIVRMQGNSQGYHPDTDDVALKSLSFWPSEDYLNIWVCFLQDDFLGYAQFPVSTLEGLEEFQNEMAATDGVVIAYDAFGSEDDGDFDLLTSFSKGRTLTHEVGHFFGLRHIWGDNSNCASTTDYVNDTPQQNNDTNGCPGHPQTSCSNVKMFQNFMDYTNDQCMNLFTAGQVERMQVIIENSIRRVSLLSSPGLVNPPGGSQNIALRAILSPKPVSCAVENSLKIRFQNLSDEPLTYAEVLYTLNDGSPQTSNHLFTPIASLDYGEISLPINLPEGEHLLSVTINSPNGAVDVSPEDNTLNRKIVISSAIEKMPTRERFESALMDQWTIVNPDPDAVAAWETTLTFYNQSLTFTAENMLARDSVWLVSPVLDFSLLTESHLRFDWSYRSNSTNPTSLELRYTTDCGLSYQRLPEFSLRATSVNLVPSLESDWDSEVIRLAPLIGESEVRLAFVASAYLGNPLYLDNIELYAGKASPKLPLEETVAIYAADPLGINLTFNVTERQHVVVSVFDTMGKTVLHGVEPEILNQTYTYQLRNLQTGIYIVRIKADNDFYTQKVFIQGR